MTAEIAILNKNGIALAADSKVTIGAAGQEKTFDTVNKLFTLSKLHPIGVMVYGNAEFMRYPWETIVKMYRQKKGDANEPTVAKWGEHLVHSLAEFGNIREQDKTINLQTVISSVFERLQERTFADARRKNIPAPSKDYVALLLKTVQQDIIKLQKVDDFFNPDQQSEFIDKFGNTVGDLVNSYFSGFEDADLIAKARELALFSCFKREYSPQSSGLVVAGFGKDEYFPAVVDYETDGYVGDVLKISVNIHFEITRDSPSIIMPFAQSDMVQRFMNGIDPQLTMFIPRIMSAVLTKNCLEVLEKYGDAQFKNDPTKEQIRAAVKAAVSSMADPFKQFQSAHYSDPIMQMVSLLPKDELPNLAESLVALTSLKRHVSRDAETVGGPVDVALISRGDGFVWIKRKHYFKPELNPQFARNYMRGIEGTGDPHERAAKSAPRPARRPNPKKPARRPKARAAPAE